MKEKNGVVVIINEQHKILEDQKNLIDTYDIFKGWEFLKVPSEGWTIDQMEDLIFGSLINKVAVIFISPIPAMIKMMTQNRAEDKNFPIIRVFHNDNREKKEISGKVIMTVAKTGWILV